jgi:Hsp20/alpha crystallin family
MFIAPAPRVRNLLVADSAGAAKIDTGNVDMAVVRRNPRRATSVFRQVGLPADVRAEDIKASFENGVLSIAIPRAQKAAPQRIPVTTGSSAATSERVVEHAPSA